VKEILILAIITVASTSLLAAAAHKQEVTAELVEAAHKVLDLGYDCAKSGAERVACHAQLATAIKNKTKCENCK
jgi:hypothetical protein